MLEIILWVIALAVLFILVILNNKRNINKKRNLKTRTFKKDYFEKKKNKNEDLH
ncbi:hypothetical protein [Abyssalbus ytuae]|uniref:Uncharacterized protein n=1 Tax=Abyssalbus ytuae TaxID=2926907 RepID=A0A9E7A1H5_9FLAO|nr:hypothetical protein [Abyssalbus ytuae]UOB18006.1 hypothetical protein MQE35_01600 [Abyssalbus ytuae]